MAKLDRIQALQPTPQPAPYQYTPYAGDTKLDRIGGMTVDNTGKINPNDPSVPEWRKLGFSSEAQYRDAYGLNQQPGGGAAPGGPTTSTDPFGDYLRNNKGAGDAWAYLEALLNDYGLGTLNDFVKENIIQGRSQTELVQRLREQDAYKKRFAAIEQMKSQGLPAISEAEVVQYEKEATALMRRAGMPSGFWDQPEDFVKLQVNQISLAELNKRVDDGYLQYMRAPAEEREQMARLGVTPGEAVAFFIDPDRGQAAVMDQFAQAQRAAEAQRAGYGQLTAAQSAKLVALGISSDAAQQGFSKLTQGSELYGARVGTDDNAFSQDDQLDAQFGNNVAKQEELRRRAQRNLNTFKNDGDFASGQEGFAGLGRAR